MKRLLFVLLGFTFSAAVMAQVPEKKAEMKDLRTDVREKKDAKHQVNKDVSHVRVKKAIKDRKVVAAENRDMRKDSRRLKRQGVSHPIVKAKRQVKVQDDNRKDHTN
jgi:Ni/Co efflux regulator RcnB